MQGNKHNVLRKMQQDCSDISTQTGWFGSKGELHALHRTIGSISYNTEELFATKLTGKHLLRKTDLLQS